MRIFASNEQSLLWVALTARNGGIRASQLLEVENSLTALNFDLLATEAILKHENRRQRDFARTVGAACAAAFSGETLQFDDDNDDVGGEKKNEDDYITI